MAVTLNELLRSRDERWATEKRLQREHPSDVLVVLTVVMPGSVKRDSRSLVVAHAAVEAVNAQLEGKIVFSKTRDLDTGFEGYWVARGEALDIKQQLCGIEEAHPLGRLFDIDVLGKDAVPISRTDVGFAPRRCLLCDHEARWCMRNHTHTQDEIQVKITQMVADYER